MTSSPNRLLGTVFGAVYVLVGLLGFLFPPSSGGFFSDQGGLLLGIFMVNPFHNVAHLLIGAALLIGGLSSVASAKAVNSVVGFAYLALGIVGFFLVGSAFNILALNTADHFLHLGSAVVLLIVGLGAEKGVRNRATRAA